jgi:hypothetical protein
MIAASGIGHPENDSFHGLIDGAFGLPRREPQQ